MIRAWLQKIDDSRRAKEFDRGFNYAAGRLLHGADSEALAVECDSKAMEFTAFDEGITSAIEMWESRVVHYRRAVSTAGPSAAAGVYRG